MSGHYEPFEHTADAGYRLRGATLEELFCAGAEALYEVVFGGSLSTTPGPEIRVVLTASNLADLLHDWLQRLLLLMDVDAVWVTGVVFDELSETRLAARCEAVAVPEGARQIEVKAVTYHGISVEREGSGWRGSVLFDV